MKAEPGACERLTDAQGQQAKNNRHTDINNKKPHRRLRPGKNQNIPPRLGRPGTNPPLWRPAMRDVPSRPANRKLGSE